MIKFDDHIFQVGWWFNHQQSIKSQKVVACFFEVKHLSALSAVRSTLHFPYLIEITHTVPYGFEEFMTGSLAFVKTSQH